MPLAKLNGKLSGLAHDAVIPVPSWKSPLPSSDPPSRPSSVAVALQYDPETGATPKVLASGRGPYADQILEVAFANGVKVREDADLAEILSAIGVGDDIPATAFLAVAEILSYIYRKSQEPETPLNSPS